MTLNQDQQLKSAIADRAVKMFNRFGVPVRKIDILMDIDYVNEICPMRLRELLDADDFNFSHDIGGIYRHFNRETRQLENCFIPRSSHSLTLPLLACERAGGTS